MPRTVGIYIYDEVEVLDFSGPFEVFSTASRVMARLCPGQAKPFEVFTIADSLRLIHARAALRVQPHFSISNHPNVDLLLIPGGVHNSELERPEIIDWIARTSARAELTASVCTGAFLLAKAGLLAGKAATTHWEDLADFRAMFPAITVRENRRWVDEGNIVTSAGISAGLDMSLHLVARLADEDLAVRTARQMDYRWMPNPG